MLKCSDVKTQMEYNMTVEQTFTEIERKWLMASSIKRLVVRDSAHSAIRQAYFNPICRVRIDTHFNDELIEIGKNAVISVKLSESELTRQEYNYPIPVEQAEVFLKQLLVITKFRYNMGNGFTLDWFVDDLEGLLLMEKEYTSEDAANSDEFPVEWDGIDVTGRPQFINANLVGMAWDEQQGLVPATPTMVDLENIYSQFALVTGDEEAIVPNPLIIP